MKEYKVKNCKLILTPPTEGFRNNDIRACEAR